MSNESALICVHGMGDVILSACQDGEFGRVVGYICRGACGGCSSSKTHVHVIGTYKGFILASHAL